MKITKNTADALGGRIKKKLYDQLQDEICLAAPDNSTTAIKHKEMIRKRHILQKNELLLRSHSFITNNINDLLQYFASGKSINPEKIEPRIQVVRTGTMEARLFRFACLTWSVPVSEGYGRRMRFLVWDDSNNKLIGLFALGDPVFNLRVRDEAIGWSSDDKKEKLVNVMDAFVLGAVPPYNMLLCGKLIACLIRTKEIKDIFREKYHDNEGVISGLKKKPNLIMVTTTSALGRSSIYNRLKLSGTDYFRPIGYTAGYGHFHVPAPLFNDIRMYLAAMGHEYSDNHNYGSGPNWRFRAIKAALGLLGMNKDFLCHGIQREVYLSCLAENAFKIASGENIRPRYKGLLSATEVSKLALDRWVVPRSGRMKEYTGWNSDMITELLK